MIRVSVSEARQKLPFFARLAEGGQVVVFYRRGKAIAQLVRPETDAGELASEEARVLRAVRDGRAVQAGRTGPLLPKKWKPGRHGGGLSDTIFRDRSHS